MRGLQVLVVAMGLVIVAMLAAVAITVAHRLGASPEPASAPAASVLLAEPPGTRIGSISPAGDRLAVLLQGGGPDRLVFLDAGGRVAARVSLPR